MAIICSYFLFRRSQVCPSQEYQRKLHPDDLPLRAQLQRVQKGEKCHFLVRKNPHYPRRKLQLTPIVESTKSMQLNHHHHHLHQHQHHHLGITSSTSKDTINECPQCILLNNNNNVNTTNNNNNTTTTTSTTTTTNNSKESNNTTMDVLQTTRYISPYTSNTLTSSITAATINASEIATTADRFCKMCRNSFRSCEFCNKNVTSKLSTRLPRTNVSNGITTGTLIGTTTTYNPVYNIREIRGVCNSFSALSIDKKLLDVDRSTKALSFSGALLANTAATTAANTIVQEAVNNNPAKGYGNYVYI